MLFDELGVLLEENFPSELSQILVGSGYDTLLSMQSLDLEAICEIESFVNTDRSIIKGTSYENQEYFRLKPGHRRFLIQLAEKIRDKNICITDKHHSSDFSYVLKRLIETAEANSHKHPKQCRYSEEIRYFATYIYLMCGKNCYEVLSANLPLPKANTICKYLNNSFSE